MTIKYRVGFYTEIEEIIVVRETEHNVWIRNPRGCNQTERREPKVSKYGIFFDTFEEARDCIHARLKGAVESARDQVRHATAELRAFEKEHAIRSETSVQALPVREHT